MFSVKKQLQKLLEYVHPKRRCVNAATGEKSMVYFTYAYLTEEILLYVKAVFYYSWYC